MSEFPHHTHIGNTHLNAHQHIDGLVQERRNSSALAMELRLSCTNPSLLSSSSLWLWAFLMWMFIWCAMSCLGCTQGARTLALISHFYVPKVHIDTQGEDTCEDISITDMYLTGTLTCLVLYVRPGFKPKYRLEFKFNIHIRNTSTFFSTLEVCLSHFSSLGELQNGQYCL